MTSPPATPCMCLWRSSALPTSEAKTWRRPSVRRFPSSLSLGKIRKILDHHLISNMTTRDTLDVVKQSAALCLLKLFRTDASVIPSGEYQGFIIKYKIFSLRGIRILPPNNKHVLEMLHVASKNPISLTKTLETYFVIYVYLYFFHL